MSLISSTSVASQSTLKSWIYPLKPVFFFILSVDQSLEILPKHNGLATIDDDDGNIARGVFVDFQKAFDIIDHQILLGKIDYYGIRGILNERLKS